MTKEELKEWLTCLVCGEKPDCHLDIKTSDSSVCKMYSQRADSIINLFKEWCKPEFEILTKEHRHKVIDTLSPGQGAVDALLKAQMIKDYMKLQSLLSILGE